MKKGFILLETCLAMVLGSIFLPILIFSWSQVQHAIQNLLMESLQQSELRYIQTTLETEFSEAATVTISSPSTLQVTSTASETLFLSFVQGKLKLKRGNARFQDLNHILTLKSVHFETAASHLLHIRFELPHRTQHTWLALINETH
jgi:type II secretory pathway component PulJ